jgi:hypothetical protein
MGGNDDVVDILDEQPVDTTEGLEGQQPNDLVPQEQVKALIKKALSEQYSKLNKSLSELGKENKALREQLEALRSQTPEEVSTMLELAETQARESGDDEVLQRLLILRAKEAQRKQQAQFEAQLRRQMEIAQNEREKIENRIREAGLDPESEKFDNLWTYFELVEAKDGKFEKVHSRLDRMLGVTNPKQKESEVDLKERLRRQILEEEGLLSKEKAQPSGSGKVFTAEEIAKMPVAEYRKHFPTYADFIKAQQEGRIK